MDNAIWIAAGVLHLLAIVDIWMSRLSNTAKTLWTFVLIFLPVVGIAAWLLTRGSAHQSEDEGPLTA